MSANIELSARLSRPTEMVIEVKGDKQKYNAEQNDEVQQVCLAEELSAILQNQVIGVSLKIALILGR